MTHALSRTHDLALDPFLELLHDHYALDSPPSQVVPSPQLVTLHLPVSHLYFRLDHDLYRGPGSLLERKLLAFPLPDDVS